MRRLLAILLAPLEVLHAWLGFVLVCGALAFIHVIEWLFGLAQRLDEDRADSR